MTGSPSLAPRGRFEFGAVRIDVDSHRLWRGAREIPLRPKAWGILHYLISRPGLLVTKEVLHREVWRDAVVSDDALTKSVAELRRALGDTARTPRFIETVHGLGFRFVAPVRNLGDKGEGASPGVETQALSTESRRFEPGIPFVGRHPELKRLHECLRRAGQGERQLVFITGEAGIGKTTLSEEFLRSAADAGSDLHVLHGQCIQQHGQPEPYMPVLEAFERVLRSPVGPSLIPRFRRMAPSWSVQVPWLLADGEPPGFQGTMMSAPPERMLREMGAFLESMAARATVVLLLEDLHWSDNATASLLSFLAERRDPARLLIIGTYRSVEASIQDHPIREVNQVLRAHRRCVHLALDCLSASEVREYLNGRFGNQVHELAPIIHRRTDGNPLFVVGIVEELIRRGQLAPTDGGWVVTAAAGHVDLAVPQDLIEMVTLQFQRLSPHERSILEAAAVIGLSFAPWMVVRVLGRDAEDVETVLQRLARSRLFLSVASRAEDVGSGKRYDFLHALHHQVIYEHLADERRRRLHQSIGEALEGSAGDRLAELAAELSTHFERSGDHLRAARYFGTCATRAQQRLAPHEAIACAEHALGLLERLPETPQRRRCELELRLVLGVSLNVTRGYTSPEVRDNYERARALCEDVGEARQLFEIVHAVWYAQMVRSDLEGAQASADELARIADQQNATEFRLRAELAQGRIQFWKGNFRAAAQAHSRLLDYATTHPIEIRAELYGPDPLVPAYAQSSLALWFLGQPDQALVRAWRGIAYAEKDGRPLGLAVALLHSTILELLCGNAEGAANLAARTAKIVAESAVANFRAASRFFRAAAGAERGDVHGGLAEMIPALVEHRETVGPHFHGIMLGFLAAAYGHAQQWEEGLRRVDEGIDLSEASGERMYAAELWRIKGELLLGKAGPGRRAKAGRSVDEAQQCFHRALEIARKQEAPSLALRCAMSLTRLAGRLGGTQEACELLRSLYATFTEGFDTKDLRDAKTLLMG